MIGSFIKTIHLLIHHSSPRGFWQNIQSPRWHSPPVAQIWCPVTLLFPKTKITFEREEISDHWWDSGQYNRSADGNWENCVSTLKGTEKSLSCVQCRLYFVSSSINVSIFYTTWLDTVWTDLVYQCNSIEATPPNPPPQPNHVYGLNGFENLSRQWTEAK